ncbi:hypothetical protein BASA84_001254 [Batrachochytrium salamandrivorans]|nr:hypothetical protein BASA81_015227 [Batrachochytrium salamandrivorans]KAH9266210.1 hypothetical protein BASA84_001254 [Batrachochytrium salamandrivorans]
MQFLCLFSFVVVASYAAALPQPAELSGKYSSNVNSDLASGLEARSYQPVADTLTDSVTLMSLKRRDDDSKQLPRTSSRETFKGGNSLSKGGGSLSKGGDKSSKGGGSLSKGGGSLSKGGGSLSKGGDESSEEDDESGTSPSTDTTSKKDTGRSQTNLEKAEQGTFMLSSTISGVGDGPDNAPRNVKAAGKARSGPTGDGLIVYLNRSLYISDKLKDWVNKVGSYAILVVYDSFGHTDYSTTVRPLRDTTTALTKRVRDLLKAINDGIRNITRKTGPFKVQFKSIHASFERIFGSYQEYFAALQAQLAKVRGTENICKYLTNAREILGQFFEQQDGLYKAITGGNIVAIHE